MNHFSYVKCCALWELSPWQCGYEQNIFHKGSTYQAVLAGVQTLKAKKNRLMITVTVRLSHGRAGNKLDTVLSSALDFTHSLVKALYLFGSAFYIWMIIPSLLFASLFYSDCQFAYLLHLEWCGGIPIQLLQL